MSKNDLSLLLAKEPISFHQNCSLKHYFIAEKVRGFLMFSSINWNNWIQHQFSPKIFSLPHGYCPSFSYLGLFQGAREKIQWDGWSSAGFLKDVLLCGCYLFYSHKDKSQPPLFVSSLEYSMSYWGYFLSMSQHSISFLFLIFLAGYGPPLSC